MSYIIGTDENVSTWGVLRSVLFTNGTNIVFIPFPDGFVFTTHNKVFPPAPGESPYTPPYFTPDSGTLVRQDAISYTPYIYFEPNAYEPFQPPTWSGYITIYLDQRDFKYMVGKTLTAAATSATINASAESPSSQLLQTGLEDWGFGLTGVEKFKVVT